ncbi:MAG: hypothetical protein AAGD13_16760 [Pseudomonadota bacterium]
MSILSGVVSLGSPTAFGSRAPQTESEQRAQSTVLEPAQDVLKVDPTIKRVVEAAGQSGRPSLSSTKGDVAVAIAPGDARYSKFVDAVLALRLTRTDAAGMSPARISELRDAAEAVFNIRSGIPRDQRPAEVFSEKRAAAAEQEAARKASDAAKVAESSETNPATDTAVIAEPASDGSHGTVLSAAEPVEPTPVPATTPAVPEQPARAAPTVSQPVASGDASGSVPESAASGGSTTNTGSADVPASEKGTD